MSSYVIHFPSHIFEQLIIKSIKVSALLYEASCRESKRSRNEHSSVKPYAVCSDFVKGEEKKKIGAGCRYGINCIPIFMVK